MGPFSNSGGLLFSAGRAGRPDKGNCLESGGIRGNMLTRRFAFAPPCGAAAPFVRDIESGRGDIKDKKRQSSYAVKSSIHAIGVKNIFIFPIHEVRKEGGGGDQNSSL
ncbi:hypothetical protein [Parablautia muri]|uniref:Uncharacterized protein n=2 Tax=Lachnospiraceae TaxID=186803 RepID=A0A9X5BI43_9FIRM|nr:hypothetical protein [Parablautia muri]NBJ94515.1 hypothetical protein [Parablautia muri]